jgi:hypothetical protein
MPPQDCNCACRGCVVARSVESYGQAFDDSALRVPESIQGKPTTHLKFSSIRINHSLTTSQQDWKTVEEVRVCGNIKKTLHDLEEAEDALEDMMLKAELQMQQKRLRYVLILLFRAKSGPINPKSNSREKLVLVAGKKAEEAYDREVYEKKTTRRLGFTNEHLVHEMILNKDFKFQQKVSNPNILEMATRCLY